MAMEISRRLLGDIAVLDVAGKVTLTACDGRVKDAVSGLLIDGHRQIILNLDKVTYIDSSGLGETVACFATALKSGARIKLVHQGKGKDLLVMAKLWTVFECHDRIEDAQAEFAQPTCTRTPESG